MTAPTAVLLKPVVLLQREFAPTAVLLSPDVVADKALTPIAVFPVTVVASRELQPKAVLPATVQPRTIPATVEVALATAAVPQQTALAPLLISTWPAVPQELAQSMMPAPGLIALVLLPVSQLQPSA